MVKIRFYTDEHVALAVANGLRQRGIDTLTARDADTLGFADKEQLAIAHDTGRVVVTNDRDYVILHNAGQAHAGIAYFPNLVSIGEMISQLVSLHQVFSAEEMVGCLEYL